MFPLLVGILLASEGFFFFLFGLGLFLGVNFVLGSYLDGTDAGGLLAQEGALAAVGVLERSAAIDVLAAVGAGAYLAVIGQGCQFLGIQVIQGQRHAAVVALAGTLQVVEEGKVQTGFAINGHRTGHIHAVGDERRVVHDDAAAVVVLGLAQFGLPLGTVARELINLDKGAVGVVLVGHTHDALGRVGVGAGKAHGTARIGLVVGKGVAAQFGVEHSQGILAALGDEGGAVGTGLQTVILLAVAVLEQRQQGDGQHGQHDADDEVAVIV